MSENFRNSYFYLLPNEILIKILGYVDTLTLLGFCEVYECDFFFQDKDVIKYINLPKKYSLVDLSPLSKKIAFEYVNTLNINCLYWISPAALRKFVTKLVNLKVLYAIKTNLSISSIDIEIYNKTKIEKLGVTFRKNDKIGFSKALNIKTLYIDVVKATSLLTPLTFEMHFPQLTNLWIDLEEPGCGHPIFNSLHAGIKTKIFCRINAPIPSINFNFAGFKRYYNNRRACQSYVMCCEKFCDEDLHIRKIIGFDENISKAWKILDELHCPLPFGPRDARKLCVDEATLYDIVFEELNFHHSGPTCNQRCTESYKVILKSKNAKTLKKLCIMSCILNDNEARKSNHESNGFKRKRIGFKQSINSHHVQTIFNNFLNLEHLEIFYCQQAYHHSSIQAYPLIEKFSQLQSLILEIPVTLDGSFLVQILKNCTKLKNLKINSLTQHENLNHNLINALPHALSLKDFRYENHRIPLDKLIEHLCLIKTQKLERIVLICNEIDKFSASPLKNLLESNPQLIFLYFIIRQATENSLKLAQRTLNTYKKTHPSKVFFVKKTEIGEIGYPIPEIHYSEMMKFDSNVATLNPLEDFIFF